VLRKGHILVIFVIGFSVTTAFAASSASVSLPSGSSVPGCEQTNACFIPYGVTIDVGGTVTWSNDDSAAHTVTSGTPAIGPDGYFDSSLFMAGTTFTITVNSPGTYPYFCIVHPWMTGSIVVLDSGYDIPKTPTISSAKSSPINRDDKTYYVYIDKMPENWKSQFGNLYNDGTAYWENKIPGLKFYVTTNREKADFVVQWASQFVGTKLGYWTTNTENSYGKPYMAVTLGFMDDDSVAWQERKFHQVDSEYALEITTHELGHAIGFGHSHDPNDIMYGTIYNYEQWLRDRDSGTLTSSGKTVTSYYDEAIVLQGTVTSYYDEAIVLQGTVNSQIENLKNSIYSNQDLLYSMNYESPEAQDELDKARKSLDSAKEYLANAEWTQIEGENLIANGNAAALYKYEYSLEMIDTALPQLIEIDSHLSAAEELEKSYHESKPTEESEKEATEEKEKTCFLFWCW